MASAAQGPKAEDVSVETTTCDPSTLTWSPSTLPRLVVWLDAASLTGAGPVSLWADQSPEGNSAIQTSAASPPSRVASAIGGLPAVHFDGSLTGLQVPDARSLQWGTGDYSMFVVARFSGSGPADQMLFQKCTDDPWNGPSLYVNGSGADAVSQVSGGVSASSETGLDAAPHLFAGRRVGTSVEVRIDGRLRGLVSPPLVDVSAPGWAFTVGRGYGAWAGWQALDGDIAEIVAVRGRLVAADMHTLECHLKLKYGL